MLFSSPATYWAGVRTFGKTRDTTASFRSWFNMALRLGTGLIDAIPWRGPPRGSRIDLSEPAFTGMRHDLEFSCILTGRQTCDQLPSGGSGPGVMPAVEDSQ